MIENLFLIILIILIVSVLIFFLFLYKNKRFIDREKDKFDKEKNKFDKEKDKLLKENYSIMNDINDFHSYIIGETSFILGELKEYYELLEHINSLEIANGEPVIESLVDHSKYIQEELNKFLNMFVISKDGNNIKLEKNEENM